MKRVDRVGITGSVNDVGLVVPAGHKYELLEVVLNHLAGGGKPFALNVATAAATFINLGSGTTGVAYTVQRHSFNAWVLNEGDSLTFFLGAGGANAWNWFATYMDVSW